MITRIAIVGGGVTGLATGAWLEHDHGIDDFVILEASSRAGGKIRSEHDAGFTLEWGPHGFLDNAPDTLELATIQALEDQLVRADEAAADRFILRQGKLRHVATSPVGFMLSSILHTPVAIEASIVIARAFVRLRKVVRAHKELARKVKALERKLKGHDVRIDELFEAIQGLMEPPARPPKRIGFHL